MDPHLLKKFPTLYKAGRFIAGFVTASHLPCPETDQLSTRPHNPFPENSFQYYPSIMAMSLKWSLPNDDTKK